MQNVEEKKKNEAGWHDLGAPGRKVSDENTLPSWLSWDRKGTEAAREHCLAPAVGSSATTAEIFRENGNYTSTKRSRLSAASYKGRWQSLAQTQTSTTYLESCLGWLSRASSDSNACLWLGEMLTLTPPAAEQQLCLHSTFGSGSSALLGDFHQLPHPSTATHPISGPDFSS